MQVFRFFWMFLNFKSLLNFTNFMRGFNNKNFIIVQPIVIGSGKI